jgi:hypothetical protein
MVDRVVVDVEAVDFGGDAGCVRARIGSEVDGLHGGRAGVVPTYGRAEP